MRCATPPSFNEIFPLAGKRGNGIAWNGMEWDGIAKQHAAHPAAQRNSSPQLPSPPLSSSSSFQSQVNQYLQVVLLKAFKPLPLFFFGTWNVKWKSAKMSLICVCVSLPRISINLHKFPKWETQNKTKILSRKSDTSFLIRPIFNQMSHFRPQFRTRYLICNHILIPLPHTSFCRRNFH